MRKSDIKKEKEKKKFNRPNGTFPKTLTVTSENREGE